MSGRKASNATAEYFSMIQEPFASGFFEEPERSRLWRFSNAYRRFFEQCRLPEYCGGQLYPSGLKVDPDYAVIPDFSYTYRILSDNLDKKCRNPEDARKYAALLKEDMDGIDWPPTEHCVGGYAYTHSIPNYQRIAREGLDAYRQRIEALKESDFRSSLLWLMEGIACYHRRMLEKLRREEAPEKLIRALEKVPFSPAENLYEAMVCRNFIFYLDFCDNPGRLDQELIDYYQGEDITELLKEFFRNVDINDGWSSAIGPDYNPLTLQILEAIRGKRRPSLELRVTRDMPEEIWEAAASSVREGGGNPSFYNEELYQKVLAERFPGLSGEDRMKFNGGGCTETMFAGISRVGSLDMGINTALVLRRTMESSLVAAGSFREFYERLFEDLRITIDETINILNDVYRQRMERCPQPVRTLLVDDCIDKETEFNAGGARISYGVINMAGVINVIDSLLAIRELIFERGAYTAERFLQLLDQEDAEFYQVLNKCPCFGVDDQRADDLAAAFTKRLFAMLDDYHSIFGEGFIPASIQFATYADVGKSVGATPDGRRKGAPLCDSLAAIHGKDVLGPTALLNSVARLNLSKLSGTPVLNLSLDRKNVPKYLKPLLVGYFEKGGMQAQITCADREEMLDALEHPERHENLIVRIGGYSEYFNRLPEDLKRTVIDRTIQA